MHPIFLGPAAAATVRFSDRKCVVAKERSPAMQSAVSAATLTLNPPRHISLLNATTMATI
jgi:hypothetical protein